MKFLCWAVLLFLADEAFAQRVVSGLVTDMRGEPLSGAVVTLKEAPTKGAVADASGKYVFVLPEEKEYTMQVSFVGYLSQERVLKAGYSGEENFKLEEDVQNLETVVVTGTRTPKLLKDVPIVTRVITSDDIQKVDATHIGDLLQSELPGVEFSYSMNQQVSLNMQGFGGNAVLFLVDGERLAGETLDNVDYSRLNLDNVERVEIVKGAASSLYGSNAVGGVVNIISKTSTEPWTLNLNGRYGAHNEQRYGGTFSFNVGKLNSTTNVQHTSVDAIDLTNGTGESVGDYSTVYGNETWNFKERLIYTVNDHLKLTGRAGYFFRERNVSETSKDRYRDFSGGLKANYTFDKNNDLEVGYTFDQYDKSDYLPLSGNDIRDYSNVQHTLRALYNRNIMGKHTLTIGGDYMHDYLMSYQFEDNGSEEQFTVDAFAQFDMKLSDKLDVIAGLRYDYYSEADAENVSSKVGVMYKIGNCALRGSYAGGFRAPTLKEMYMDFFMGNIFMIYGNEDLKPETSQNFSLSAEYLKGRYNLTVTGYYNLVDNRITTAWDQEQQGMVYLNIDDVRIAGMDVNASVKFPCGIGTRVSYAYTHEHVGSGQPYVSSTRPHTATVRVEYDKKWKNYAFNVMLSGRVLSKVTVDEYTSYTSYEETEQVTYPAYTIWKLSLTQKIWKGISLTMAVDNLFNYVPSYYYNNSPSTTGTTFMAGLSLDVDKLFK